MSEVVLVKTLGGALMPFDDASRELIAKLKTGQGVRADIKRIRNYKFHRKAFALFQLGFEAWEPSVSGETYKGEPVAKDFERFRKDITILAGYRKAVFNARGEVRVEAESISFASMDETQFEIFFKTVLNVIWSRILRTAGYRSAEEVEAVLNQLLGFDS